MRARAGLVIELADEGPGVPAAIRDRLFEPFVTRGKKGARFRLTLPLREHAGGV